jgi:hypothetical protein
MSKKTDDNFQAAVLRVMRAMSLTKSLPTIAGTQAYRDSLYAADYDMYQVVKLRGDLQRALRALARKLKDTVRTLQSMNNTYIGNIKLGSVPEWVVIPDSATVKNMSVIGYDYRESKEKVEQLADAGIIDSDEKAAALRLLKPTMSPMDLVAAQDEIKFHIVRWTPKDILRGYAILRDDRRFSIEDGFTTPGLSKLDVISLVDNNKYADFSVIWEVQHAGKVLNPIVQPEIKLSVLENFLMGNYFKMTKRMLSLARRNSKSTTEPLLFILNSELGILYTVISDLQTIIYMAENYRNLSEERIDFELDMMKQRLGNVSLRSYLNKEPVILKRLTEITKDKIRKPTTVKAVQSLVDQLSDIMNAATKKELVSAGLLPLSARWLP